MSMQPVDIIILGQGLAGTALAWWCHWSGLRVMVIDRAAAVTSSKIAAGLMTPITGQRLVPSWRWGEFWPIAVDFYRRVEQETAAQLLHSGPMVRCFTGLDDTRYFERRLASGEFLQAAELNQHRLEETVARGNVVRWPASPELDVQRISTPFGSFEMLTGGRLDVARYLEVSRRFFEQHEAYLAADVQLPYDIELVTHGVELPQWKLSAHRMVCCQGYDGADNPWFKNIEFQPAKGEILTVRIPGWTEQRVIHGDVWLVPIGEELVRVGATYDWSRFDNIPTEDGRRELETRLQSMICGPYEVVDHVAAVRPILRDPRPVLGFHHEWKQLAYLNGLASKGALMAPYFGRHLTRVMSGAEKLDPSVDLARRTKGL